MENCLLDMICSKRSTAVNKGVFDSVYNNTFNVSTTVKEWGVYATQSFIKVSYENTNSPSGTVTVKVEEDHGRDINLAIATNKAMELFLAFLKEEDAPRPMREG